MAVSSVSIKSVSILKKCITHHSRKGKKKFKNKTLYDDMLVPLFSLFLFHQLNVIVVSYTIDNRNSLMLPAVLDQQIHGHSQCFENTGETWAFH